LNALFTHDSSNIELVNSQTIPSLAELLDGCCPGPFGRPRRAFGADQGPFCISNITTGWHIDHIYDGKFPWPTRNRSLHAVKNGNHFTQAAGLVAIHPVAEVLKDEYSHFAWLLRREARRRFGYDPDGIFSEKIDEYGFGKQGNMKIPRGTTY